MTNNTDQPMKGKLNQKIYKDIGIPSAVQISYKNFKRMLEQQLIL